MHVAVLLAPRLVRPGANAPTLHRPALAIARAVVLERPGKIRTGDDGLVGRHPTLPHRAHAGPSHVLGAHSLDLGRGNFREPTLRGNPERQRSLLSRD